MELSIVNSPNRDLSKTNKVYVNPSNLLSEKIILFQNGFPYLVDKHPDVEVGAIGLNQIQRKLHQYVLNAKVKVSIINSIKPLETVHCSISIPGSTQISIDCEDLEATIKSTFDLQPLSEMQDVYLSYMSSPVTLHIETVIFSTHIKPQSILTEVISTVMRRDSDTIGLITNDTKFIFVSNSKNIKLKQQTASVGSTLFKKDLNLLDLGIGGLDKEFATIFRKAFATRAIPKKIAKKMGIKHVKGVLLYGPPGTGKTLIARKIGEILNCEKPKIVSGPSIKTKWVGGSAENIRELFAEAEADRLADPDGEGEKLHLIILDEFDSICKKRGSTSDSTGTDDEIVNQLLSKIDGVDQLNNILIVAMTNRKDTLDEAALRGGRLEVHIEIGLPNESGRQDILKIHTTKLKELDKIADNVDLSVIAYNTKNYTGAELESIIMSATSFAISRELNMNNLSKTTDNINPILTQQDFLDAIDDVPTIFGRISDEINFITTNPFIMWNEELDRTKQLIMMSIETLKHGNIASFLVTGPTGIGKTKFLSHVAKELNIACVKMISPESLLRVGNIQNYLTDTIDTCQKADISILFLDSFERIVKWSKLGYRYDNDALQVLKSLLRITQKPNKKMIIFCTANDTEVLQNLEIYDMFDSKFEYPDQISFDEIVSHFPNVISHLEEETVTEGVPVSRVMRIIKYES
jgi:vesicle-fusing ATPase